MTGKEKNRAKGIAGEVMAVKYLRKHHYKILATNYTTQIGEIDIIAKKKDVYHIVEVKSRKDVLFGYPREAVDKNKQHKIRQVATLYLIANKLTDVFVSFDVIEIIGEEITFIEHAFT